MGSVGSVEIELAPSSFPECRLALIQKRLRWKG